MYATEGPARLPAEQSPPCFRAAHVLGRGEALEHVARRYGMAIGRLYDINPGLPSRPRLGSAIVVEQLWHIAPEPPSLWRELARGPRGTRRVALTFDCGWTPRGAVEKLLETLDEREAPATFFLTGPFIEAHPGSVRAIARAGHSLGNHTWSHPHCPRLDAPSIYRELRRVEDAVTSLTGRSTRPWWRPPYGERDRRVLRAAAAVGYRSAYWTIDSLDWTTDPPATSATVYRRVCVEPFEGVEEGAADPLDGAIVLFHAASQASRLAMPDIVGELRRRGYSLVALERMLELGG